MQPSLPEKDWTFAANDTKNGSHGFHIYPSRMMPDVARRLIQLYCPPKSLVLDPFCGSGGVLVESMLHGHPSVGLDINPLACLVARVKTTPINPKALLLAWNHLYYRILIDKKSQKHMLGAKLLEKAAHYSNMELSEDMIRRASESLKHQGFHVPELSGTNVLYWFKPKTLVDLIVIGSQVNEIKQRKIREFFQVCLSSAIRKSSGTRKNEWKLYRIPLKNWGNFEPDAVESFRNQTFMNIKRMKEFRSNLKAIGKLPFVKISQADFRKIVSRECSPGYRNLLYTRTNQEIQGKVSLIVTSPPYGDSPTTVAYGQFSRYSLIFLGYEKQMGKEIDRLSLGGDLNTGENTEIASLTFREAYRKIAMEDERRAKQIKSYFVDLNICLKNMSSLLTRGGFACLVLGNRTIKGHLIRADKIITDLGEEAGFLAQSEIFSRRIPRKRIPWKTSPSNLPGKKVQTISHENIIILKKSN